jgi:hypothetical protein
MCWQVGELYCDSTSTCVPRLALDESCSRDTEDEFGSCELGLACDAGTEVCVDRSGSFCE